MSRVHLMLTGATVLLLASIVLLTPGIAQAATFQPANAATHAHNLSYPLALGATRSTRSGITPLAAFPTTQCFHDLAYIQPFAVHGRTAISFATDASGLRLEVLYLWCPRWSGDAEGLNFSEGEVWALSSCATIDFGLPDHDLQGRSVTDGAWLWVDPHSSFDPNSYIGDSATWTQSAHWLCPQTSPLKDFSQTSWGDLRYQAGFSVDFTSCPSHASYCWGSDLTVETPTYQ